MTELALELDVIKLQGQINYVGVVDWWRQRRVVGIRVTRRKFAIWRILFGSLPDLLPTFVTPYLPLTLASV